ncbi:MAG: EamA family transporter [archaeon]
MNLFNFKKIDKKVIIGALAIMLAAFFWSLDGVFIRPQFYILPAALVVFLEHLLGGIMLSPFIFTSWQKIKQLSRKSWGAILWVCVFGGVIGTIAITKAFFAAFAGETSFATVILLQKLQPIFALVMASLILKEKLKPKFYLWAVIAIVAGYVLAFGKTGLSLTGVNIFHHAAFFAVIAAFAFGSSTVFGKRIVNHLDFGTTAALRFAITSVLVFIIIVFTGDIFKMGQVSSLQWQLLVVIMLTSGAVAMFIYYFGLRRVTASTATITELFWPFSAIILDFVINGNTLNTIQIIATMVLLVSFYQVVAEGKVRGLKFKAVVISGKGRGKRIGFPTANLDRVDLDIPHGVYLVEAKINGKVHNSLLHFGFKETFDEKPSLEVYIGNFKNDIYGKVLKVKVIKKIREVIKFKSIKELKTQIQKDLKELK